MPDPSQIITVASEHAAALWTNLQLKQRITGLHVTPQPNGVILRFATAIATSPIVEIYRRRVDENGKIVFLKEDLLRVAFNFLPSASTTKHVATMRGLPQSTRCVYRITAGAGKMASAVRIGTFRTGTRHVTATVESILVWNDGDSWPSGAGDFQLGWALYDEDGARIGDSTWVGAIDTGALLRYPLGKGAAWSSDNVGDWVSVYFEAHEDDTFWGSFSSAVGGPDSLPSDPRYSSNSDAVFANAFHGVSLPNTSGSRRIPFSLGTGPRDIHVDTHGWLTVHVTVDPPQSHDILKVIWMPWAVTTKSAQGAAVGKPGKGAMVALSADGLVMLSGWRRERGFAPIGRERVEAVAAAALDDQLLVVGLDGTALRAAVVDRSADPPGELPTVDDETATTLTIAAADRRVAVITSGSSRTARVRFWDGEWHAPIELDLPEATTQLSAAFEGGDLLLAAIDGDGDVISAVMGARGEVDEWVRVGRRGEAVALVEVGDDREQIPALVVEENERPVVYQRVDGRWSEIREAGSDRTAQ